LLAHADMLSSFMVQYVQFAATLPELNSAKHLDNIKWQQSETGTVWVARQPLY